MSLSKENWEESIERRRGWNAPNKFVCTDCVEDEHLQVAVASYRRSACVCDYCGRVNAAPVSAILEPIGNALNRYFGAPGAVNVPRYEGVWFEDPVNTCEALMSLPLKCHTGLFQDIANSFHNDEWIACDGSWLKEHEGERMTYIWDHFAEVAKHETRYFLGHNNVVVRDMWGDYPHPVSFLDAIGKVAIDLGLISMLDPDCTLYRARYAQRGQEFQTLDELGPPPKGTASAGRMNPAGISYLYLAKERRTALGEVLSRPPYRASVGKFRLKRSTVVLDLTIVPEPPSVFDIDNYEGRQLTLFLREFVQRIARPVEKDGREHVEYVPSQVVSEFFSQVFSIRVGEYGIGGVIYPSTIVPDGENVVIFPPKGGTNWNEIIDLIDTEHLFVDDWSILMEKIGQ